MSKSFFGLNIDWIPFPNSEITWAGECPWRFRNESPRYFCFGADNGSIFIYNSDCVLVDSSRAPRELESINGIAFDSNAMAVSTPSEILITVMPATGGNQKSIHLDQCAYGVVTARKGGFLAPLGPRGLLHMRQVSEKKFLNNSFYPINADVFFYKVASVGKSDDDAEVFVCAARRNGVVTVAINAQWNPENMWLGKGKKAEHDIVDVCPIPSTKYPFAVVCLGIDATLHFAFDIRVENPPVSLQLLGLRGTPYSVLAAQGHIFVLTSEEFCIFPGMTTRFHSNEAFKRRNKVFRTPVQAMDCAVAYQRYILLIVEGGVLIFDVGHMNLLTQNPASALLSQSEGQIAEIDVIEPLGEMTGWETQRLANLQTVSV